MGNPQRPIIRKIQYIELSISLDHREKECVKPFAIAPVRE